MHSQQLGVRSGVRGEGSTISPLIFGFCINDLVSLLKSKGYSCYLENVYVGCLLFTDDLLIIIDIHETASICMLNVCYHYCFKWDLQSTVMLIGKHDAEQLTDMFLWYWCFALHGCKRLNILVTFLLSIKDLELM